MIPGLDDPHDAAGIVEAPMSSGVRGRFVPLRTAQRWQTEAFVWGATFGLLAGVVLGLLL
jgi:hypothetical protein